MSRDLALERSKEQQRRIKAENDMTTKHTPGPWIVSPYGDGFEVDSAAGLCIAQTQQLRQTKRKEDHAERKANARLIAAAPELLDKLRTMTSLVRLDYGNLDADVWQEIQETEALIAKATGETP